MTKLKPLRDRILNRLGVPTQADIRASSRSSYQRGWNEAVESGNGGPRRKRRRPRPRIAERTREAYFDDGNDDPATGALAAGGAGYRAMTGSGIHEPAITWEQNLAAAYQLKESNPLINRMGEISRDYIIGQGIVPKAPDPPLQTILDEFWRINDMPSYISELTRQLSDYGAQVVPAFVRSSDGRVKLGYIDPSLIQRVITDPQNAREMWAVVVKGEQAIDKWTESTGTRVYRIIREDDGIEVGEKILPPRHPGKLVTARQSRLQGWESVMLAELGLEEYTGDCFYIRKNADSNQTIGRSDHLQVADTVDQHNATLWAVGEREEIANIVIGLLRIIGDDDDVRDWQKKINDWTKDPGSLFVVNESVADFDMNSPVLNQTSSIATVDAQRVQIIGSEGYPVAWLGNPQGAHLATAQAQGDPTWRTLRHDQGMMQAWFVKMLEFARDQAQIAGHYLPLDDDVDASVSLPMPEMTVRDIIGISGAFSGMVGAMSIAIDSNLITREAAIDAIAKILSELDIDIDTDELKDELANEQQTTALTGGDLFDNRRDWDNVHPVLEEA